MLIDLESALPNTNTVVSALSHDLRSPLNSIIGFSEILVSERVGKLNDEQKKELNIILRRGVDLLKILDELVDYCKSVDKNEEPDQALFALHPFLHATLEKLRRTLPNKETLLVYTPHAGSCRVAGEEQKLHLILEQIFEVGSTLIKPRKISVNVNEIQRDEGSPSRGNLRIEIVFIGPGTLKPGSLLSWNGAGSLPGRVLFAMHLSRYYTTLMGGGLSVSKPKGRLVFHLDLCKEEL